MPEKAPLMLPNDDAHKNTLVNEHGYREGFFKDVHQSDDTAVTIIVEDRTTKQTVEIPNVHISSLYGANKDRIPRHIKDDLDEHYYQPNTPIDLEPVAERLLMSLDTNFGLPFVYHESYFE